MPDAERPPPGAFAGIEDWRKLVETSLKGRDFASLRSTTRDGIVIEPLYERRREGQPIWSRGGLAPIVVQPVDDADPDRANEQARADIEGGATGLSLRFAGGPSANGFGLPTSAEALRIALEGIDLAKVQLRLEPHREVVQLAEWVRGFVVASGIAPERADIVFGFDPVSIMAVGGTPPEPKSIVELFVALRTASFRGPFAILDARPYHEAGAGEAQELAALLANAVWWLRTLEGAGHSPKDAMPFFSASLSVDRDLLLSLAKLRAARLLWARLQDVCGAPRTRLPLHAETSRRMLTIADPHANLLRNTLAAFAACAGGADGVLVQPHTAALGKADSAARALARNIPHLLSLESDLGRASDPGAGSGAIEALTDALAERGWAEFQAIEGEGGIVESIRTGAFPARIAKARAALLDEVAGGRAPLVGSTLYEIGDQPVAGLPSAVPGGPLPPIRLEALAKAAA